ncbi:MAG: hypothetical protein HDT43_07240 [Ruminococcaceae bacterium]|nr:hypothetical protein [Oscillospiraceae bacterium]
MKHKLTKYELLGSLAFPVGIMVWTAYKYISGSIELGDLALHFTHRLSFIIAFVLCGVVPLLLTLIMRVDTSEQFLPRLLIFLCTFAAINIAEEFLSFKAMMVGEGILLLISLVFSGLFFHIAKPVKLSAWIVIFLGNPCLVHFICYVMKMRDLEDLIQHLNITLY